MKICGWRMTRSQENLLKSKVKKAITCTLLLVCRGVGKYHFLERINIRLRCQTILEPEVGSCLSDAYLMMSSHNLF